MMKRLLFAAFIISIAAYAGLSAQERSFLTYRDLSDMQRTSPGALRTGLFGFDNPSLLNYNVSPMDMMLILSDPKDNQFKFNRYGLFYGSNRFGYGSLTQKFGDYSITDYRLSLAWGTKSLGFGMNYGFTGGDKGRYGRHNTLGWGLLIRPSEYLSISGFQTYAFDSPDAESVVDVAVRPVKDIPITLFADASMFHDQNLEKATWSCGASVEPIDGVRVNGRYFDNKSFSLSLELSLYTWGFGAQTGISEGGDNLYKSYSIRMGGPDRSFIKEWLGNDHWVALTLGGDIKYQKYLWFDNSTTLSNLLNKIDEAANDKKVIGMVIDGREISGGAAMLWEVREKLQEFKNKGKKIVIFLERPSTFTYYFATVADKIILDNMGSVSINGFAMSKSYYKQMLDKLGIGFEEIRLFKYKSAAETFARDSMSEGDREQNQRLLDDMYGTIRSGVAASRNFSPEKFDELVDGAYSYLAKDALKNNLVDTLARWQDMEDIIAKISPEDHSVYSLMRPIELKDPIDDRWGNHEKNIAVIYAVGNCSMNSGINARSLVDYVEAAVNSPSIKAIVLRVDSPGGDALASDYIAEVIRKNKGKKPIIISQGAVAASGGYWLSMNADTIISTPFTITGSIGVISSWIYDKGLTDSLGINTSVIKRGKYSDLGTSFRLPIIPIGLPIRNLNSDERKQFEDNISSLYEDFVTKVADARTLPYKEVDEVAQGRVWTGTDAKLKKLVDEIGTLSTAINLAKEKAGITKEDEVRIIEFPHQQLFDFSSLFSNLFGFDTKVNLMSSDIEQILLRIENNGTPMPILPIDYNEILNK